MARSCLGLLTVGMTVALIDSPAPAGGILPDRDNKVLLRGQFGQQAPGFLLIFSAQPLRDSKGQLVTSLSEAELADLKPQNGQLAVKVHGKIPSRPGQLEYAFGTSADADLPWNNGREFRWQDWEKYSPDLWDNLCVLALPQPGAPAREITPAVINDVAIYKGGKVLYDSRARESYPNKKRIDPSLKSFDLAPRQGRYPVLNLSERMERFRRDYYELGNSDILKLAYADLGQTEKRKYAKRGNSWCSEFSSYVYRQNGIMTPDPDRADVHWKSMRAYFEKNGRVFPAREVAGWSDAKKRTTIPPGSFVSVLLGDSTHSIIFTTWVSEQGQPISKYVGVSGNNRGMVWPHAPLKLPTPEQFKGMNPEQLREYDQKVYFAVPADAKSNPG